ncbi:MAG: D-threitol dehydrogenase [Porticoccaceae bacterium]|nr:MAG: D-threitol dehydrogenase [Porticoccaceae bacterium]
MAGRFALEGRLAVVTGGARGIGAGIARVLAEAGARVVIADRDPEAAAAAAARLAAAGFEAEAVAVDLADEGSVVAAFGALVERRGPPWALVNNAGLQDRERLLEGTAAHWERMMAVNARGAFFAIRELGRAMAAGGAGGRIVNVASAALIGSIVAGLAAYTASKAALVGLARAAAFELAPAGITVNTILPGGVDTPGARAASGPPPEGPARRPPPLGPCTPEDIGAAVLYFVSPAAARVTNQVLAVDGGFSVT